VIKARLGDGTRGWWWLTSRNDLIINKLTLINEQVFFMFYIVVQRGFSFLFKLLNSSLG